MCSSSLELEFPQYRKYKNGKSYFRIESKEEFTELRIEPSKEWKRHTFKAKILPDRNFIADLLNDYAEYCISIKKEEFMEIDSRISD